MINNYYVPEINLFEKAIKQAVPGEGRLADKVVSLGWLLPMSSIDLLQKFVVFRNDRLHVAWKAIDSEIDGLLQRLKWMLDDSSRIAHPDFLLCDILDFTLQDRILDYYVEATRVIQKVVGEHARSLGAFLDRDHAIFQDITLRESIEYLNELRNDSVYNRKEILAIDAKNAYIHLNSILDRVHVWDKQQKAKEQQEALESIEREKKQDKWLRDLADEGPAKVEDNEMNAKRDLSRSYQKKAWGQKKQNTRLLALIGMLVVCVVAFWGYREIIGPERAFKKGNYYLLLKKPEYDQASSYYYKAWERGHAGAAFALSELLKDGRVVRNANDRRKFMLAFLKGAAEKGHVEAQKKFASYHEKGEYGISQSYNEAYYWYYIASLYGDEAAKAKTNDLITSFPLISGKVSKSEADKIQKRADEDFTKMPKKKW